MNMLDSRFGRIAARVSLFAVLVGASGSVMADVYNIMLKTSPTDVSPAGVQSCATGGFTFTKTTVGSFLASTPSVTLAGSNSSLCFGVNSSTTLNTGILNVTVTQVSLNGQDQGPNVAAILGSLSSGGNGNNDYTITFNLDKTFRVTRNTGQDPQVGSGVYHIYNINSVPEPETMWLTLAGLSALVFSRRTNRRRN